MKQISLTLVFFLLGISIIGLSSNALQIKENLANEIKAPYTIVPDSLNVLFIGNSFTFRNDLPILVKKMAEEGNQNLKFNFSTVVYGGRILKDHWRLGSQNFIRQSSLSIEEELETIKYLQETVAKDTNDIYAERALMRHQELLKNIKSGKRLKWDLVVLQSWRDDYDGENSDYLKFAPMFAEIIKAQGAKILIYETAPHSQNAEPLTSLPDKQFVLEKERYISNLAKQIDAYVVPMSMVVLQCQLNRPDLTLRYKEDAHPNQTMAYLTAATFYGALFGRSPQGLSLNSVKDTKALPGNSKLDMNGDPLEKIFTNEDKIDLQRISWSGLIEFQNIK